MFLVFSSSAEGDFLSLSSRFSRCLSAFSLSDSTLLRSFAVAMRRVFKKKRIKTGRVINVLPVSLSFFWMDGFQSSTLS